MTDCLFCKISTGDLPCHKLYEDDKVIAFLDIFPVSSGHTLVVPKTHEKNALETTDEDLLATMHVVKKIAPAVLSVAGTDSCRILTNVGEPSGQSVFHMHMHIIPCFEGQAPTTRKDFDVLASEIRSNL